MYIDDVFEDRCNIYVTSALWRQGVLVLTSCCAMWQLVSILLLIILKLWPYKFWLAHVSLVSKEKNCVRIVKYLVFVGLANCSLKTTYSRVIIGLVFHVMGFHVTYLGVVHVFIVYTCLTHDYLILQICLQNVSAF